MNCPHCGEEIQDLEEMMEAATAAILFRRRLIGFAELKAAADKLEQLRIKYPQKEGADGKSDHVQRSNGV